MQWGVVLFSISSQNRPWEQIGPGVFYRATPEGGWVVPPWDGFKRFAALNWPLRQARGPEEGACLSISFRICSEAAFWLPECTVFQNASDFTSGRTNHSENSAIVVDEGFVNVSDRSHFHLLLDDGSTPMTEVKNINDLVVPGASFSMRLL